MDKKNRSPEEKVYLYMDKEEFSSEEKRDFFNQLGLLDWNKTKENYGQEFNDRVIQRVLDENIEDLESIANIIELYNNPYGIYTLEFAELVVRIYLEDNIKFIKALNLVKDEAINIVYAFRLKRTFADDSVLKRDMEKIKNSALLSDEEEETANNFATMYRTICVS